MKFRRFKNTTGSLKGGIKASASFKFILIFLKNRVLVTLFLPFGDYRLTKLFYILITENAFSIF
ncbi:hypothetical protein OUO_1231 [Helicobacter pylori R046Wa]|nr:hypothetical protein OUO_1231 [Helicobacter pylori R046Wa]